MIDVISKCLIFIINEMASSLDGKKFTDPVRYGSSKFGANAFTYVQVQMTSRITVRKDLKSNNADCGKQAAHTSIRALRTDFFVYLFYIACWTFGTLLVARLGWRFRNIQDRATQPQGCPTLPSSATLTVGICIMYKQPQRLDWVVAANDATRVNNKTASTIEKIDEAL
jgi:hypothetical protein